MNRSGDESFIVKLIWTILTACGGPGQCHSLNGHIPVLAHTRWVRSMGSLDRFVLVGINCVRAPSLNPQHCSTKSLVQAMYPVDEQRVSQAHKINVKCVRPLALNFRVILDGGVRLKRHTLARSCSPGDLARNDR